MRLVIIGVIAVLLLGGGGAGAYFFFMKPAEASSGDAAADPHKSAKKEKGGHEAPAVEFVELDPLLLPIVDETGVTQTVSMVISLEVSDAAKAEEVKKLAPRLKDAYIQDMYGVLNRHAALKGGVIQVSTIKARLNKVSTEVLGADMVNDVLLQVVQQRPI